MESLTYIYIYTFMKFEYDNKNIWLKNQSITKLAIYEDNEIVIYELR